MDNDWTELDEVQNNRKGYLDHEVYSIMNLAGVQINAKERRRTNCNNNNYKSDLSPTHHVEACASKYLAA